MTDTVHTQDLFNGAAGSLDGHVPNVVLVGSAAYTPPTYYLLDGAGKCHVSGTYGVPLLTLTSMIYDQGIYVEMQIIAGRFGAGPGIPSLVLAMLSAGDVPSPAINFNGPGGDSTFADFSRLTVDTSAGRIDVSSSVGLITPLTPATFRMEIDPFARTTTFKLNGATFYTQDDVAFYSGSETFAQNVMLLLFNDASSGVGGGGGSFNIYDRIEIGTLGLGGGPTPQPFWGDYVNTFEIDS